MNSMVIVKLTVHACWNTSGIVWNYL